MPSPSLIPFSIVAILLLIACLNFCSILVSLHVVFNSVGSFFHIILLFCLIFLKLHSWGLRFHVCGNQFKNAI